MAPSSISIDSGVFRAVVDEATKVLALPYRPARRFGTEPDLAAGLCFLYPEFLRFVPTDFSPVKPAPTCNVISEDPIAEIFVSHAWRDRSAFWEISANVGFRTALMNADLFSLGFRAVGLTIFQETVDVIKLNVPEGASFAADPTLLRRLRILRAYLRSDCYDFFGSLDENLRAVMQYLVSKGRCPSCYLDYPPIASGIVRKPKKVAMILAEFSGKSPRFIQRHLQCGENDEPTDVQQAEQMHSMLREPARISRSHRHILYKLGAFLPATLPRSGGVPRSTLMEIVDYVRTSNSDESTILGVMMFGFCSSRLLSTARVDQRGGINFLVSSIRAPHEPGSAHRSLHRETVSDFFRPLPGDLGRRFKGLLEAGSLTHFVNSTRFLLSTNWQISMAKLEYAMLTNGPSLFGFPWILGELGFNNLKGRPSGPRSYTCTSLRTLQNAIEYYRLFDCDFVIPDSLAVPHAGSAKCPTRSALSSFFKSWRSIVDCAEQSQWPTEWRHRIAQWNSIAAGAHSLTLLCSGLRNYDMPAPTPEMLSGTVEFIFDKRYRAWYLPLPLRPYLERIRRLWHSLLTSFNVCSFVRSEQLGHLYQFIDLREDPSLVFQNPSAKLLKTGLAGSPKLSDFLPFDRFFLRHYSNTTLRDCGAIEDEVRAFHGHAGIGFDPLRAQSLNVAINRPLMDRFAAILLREVDL